VVGHSETLSRIKAAFKAQHLSHALLFEGPKGIGKFLSALGLSQFFVCEDPHKVDSACGQCPSCHRCESLPSDRVLLIAPEKGMIKLDQAKQATDFLQLRTSGIRVVLIDEAQKLNSQAANHLLKTLEEPPENCFFILVAPTGEALLPTIQSRTIRIRFKPVGQKDLLEGFQVDHRSAKQARGSVARLQEISSAEEQELRSSASKILESWKTDPDGYLSSDVRNHFSNKEDGKKIFDFWLEEFVEMIEAQKGKAHEIKALQSKAQESKAHESKAHENNYLAESAWWAFKARQGLEQNFDPHLLLEEFWIQSWRQKGVLL
jgi:DNA polymerase-3 subunit delta'